MVVRVLRPELSAAVDGGGRGGTIGGGRMPAFSSAISFRSLPQSSLKFRGSLQSSACTRDKDPTSRFTQASRPNCWNDSMTHIFQCRTPWSNTRTTRTLDTCRLAFQRQVWDEVLGPHQRDWWSQCWHRAAAQPNRLPADRHDLCRWRTFPAAHTRPPWNRDWPLGVPVDLRTKPGCQIFLLQSLQTCLRATHAVCNRTPRRTLGGWSSS